MIEQEVLLATEPSLNTYTCFYVVLETEPRAWWVVVRLTVNVLMFEPRALYM